MVKANYYGYLIVTCLFLLIAQFAAADPLLGGKKLIIGIPMNNGLSYFVNVTLNSSTNQMVHATGFCIEVFNAVVTHLVQSDLNVSYEFQAFVDSKGKRAGTYDQLVEQIPAQKYDALVGDITIVANRSNYVDFTLPYLESGVRMVVRAGRDRHPNMWVFLRPFSWNLWFTITIVCVCIGATLRFMERNVDTDSQFEGSRGQEKFTWISILWLPLVQIVLPERKSVGKNCSKFVLAVWLTLAFVLMQSYTASLSSILTLDQLQPTYPCVSDLQRNGENVGYPSASFVWNLLVSDLNFDKSKLKECNKIDDCRDALDKGTLVAIFHEIPYIKVFLKKYGTKYYRMVGPRYRTDGFGFAFPRNSNLTSYFSRAILNVTQGEEMNQIEHKYFGSSDDEYQEDQSNTYSNTPSLTTCSFAGLFLITGFLTFLALLVSESRIWKKPVMVAKTYSQKYLFSPRSIKANQTWDDSTTRENAGSTDEANNHPESYSTSFCQAVETLPV